MKQLAAVIWVVIECDLHTGNIVKAVLFLASWVQVRRGPVGAYLVLLRFVSFFVLAVDADVS